MLTAYNQRYLAHPQSPLSFGAQSHSIILDNLNTIFSFYPESVTIPNSPPDISVMSSFRETLKDSARGFIEAHSDHDMPLIRSYLAEKGAHSMHPESISAVRNNEEYLEFETWVKGLLKKHVLTIHDMAVDEAQRRVIVFMDSYGKADVGEFDMEMIMALTFTEDGKKVVKQHRFCDSKKMLDFLALIQLNGENSQDSEEKAA
jgi:hypothetical protein